MKTELKIMYLSFEHLHPDLADVDCEVEYSVERGGTSNDIVSITFLQDRITSDKDIKLIKGKYVFLDDAVHKQIMNNIY